MGKFGAIGFAGCGNMGAAIARSLLKSKKIAPSSLHLFDPNSEVLHALTGELAAQQKASLSELVTSSDILFLAMKPQAFLGSPKTFRDLDSRLVISVMAGVSTARLREAMPKAGEVIRVMPNLPLVSGYGTIGIEVDGIAEKQLQQVESLLSSCGKTFRVPARLMDSVTAVSGSGPMYVCQMIEGLILAGVKMGLGREEAKEMVYQTVLGTVSHLIQTRSEPNEMTAQVSSPGGTTIYAMHALERLGFKATLIHAVEEATDRARALAN